jgi:hypothetical protein
MNQLYLFDDSLRWTMLKNLTNRGRIKHPVSSSLWECKWKKRSGESTAFICISLGIGKHRKSTCPMVTLQNALIFSTNF